MNILLVNDDGILAPGIKKIEKILKNYGEVYVCAPSTEQSGKACSLNTFKGLTFHKIDENHVSVDGSPVDCVEVGLTVFDVKFDLLVSGCNDGYNMGYDVMYSGTCGGCIQGLFAGLKAIAFSCASKDCFDYLEEFVPMVLDYVFENDLTSYDYFLNVNIPMYYNDKGILITKICNEIIETYYQQPGENVTYIRRKRVLPSTDITIDMNAVQSGYISITPLSKCIFKDEQYEFVKNKLK